MEPKYGLDAVKTMLAALKTKLSGDVSGGTHQPFLCLFTDSLTDFPTGEDEDLFSGHAGAEAAFPGYARVLLEIVDFPDPVYADDDHLVIEIPQKEYAYDSEETGTTPQTISWVGLVSASSGVPYRIIAIVPITPTTMDADGKILRVQMNLRAFSIPYPPA